MLKKRIKALPSPQHTKFLKQRMLGNLGEMMCVYVYDY